MKKKNKHDVYKGNGGIKKSYESLRQHAMKKKKLLTNKQQELYLPHYI